MLLFASAGAIYHAGFKVPYFVFFSKDAGIQTKEAPFNMVLAMGIAAFICLLLGVYPIPLYNILPFKMDYQPYTLFHVLAVLELLMCSILTFFIFLSVNINTASA